MGNIEAKSGSGVAKDDEADDGAQEMDNNVNGAEDGHGVEGGVEHGGKDVIADPKMNADAEGEQNPSQTQGFQALVHSSPPPVARRGRGRPRCSRPAITAGNTTWEVIKIAGDKQLGEGRVLKVQAEAWLAEEDLPALQNAIATYRAKQGHIRRTRKSICGGHKRSARRRKE